MTQAQLALASGVSQRTVRRAEAGQEISDESLRCICAVLGLDCSGPEPGTPGILDPMVVAMSASARVIYPSPAPRKPETYPLSEFLKDSVQDLLALVPLMTLMILAVVFALGGTIFGTMTCILLREWAWAAYFGSVSLAAMALMAVIPNQPGRRCIEVYRLWCWAALGVSPLSWGAHAVMSATGPICLPFSGPYLMACVVAGIPLGLDGAVRLLVMRFDDAGDVPQPPAHGNGSVGEGVPA